MSSLRLSFTVLTCIVLVVIVSNVGHAADDFPGVVELVGYNNRKARMGHLDTLVTPPMKKTRADIETVKQNIEEYNKLLKVDTKKLSDQQKDMLERIVERVARLKESLDIEVETTTAQASTQQTGKPIATTTTESADIAEDKTNSIPEMLATTILSEQKLTTTTARPDTSEARANINNLSTSSGTNRVSGKAKIRPNTTRRPTQSSAAASSSSSSATKTTTKRTTGIRPSIKPVGATVSAAVGNTATMPGSFGATQKIATITTIQPLIKQQLQKQQDVIHDVLMKQQQQQQQQSSQQEDSAEEKTLPSSSSVHHQGSPLGAGSEGSELMYDSNVTTSSLIDSLANHAREDYYNTPSLSESTKEKKPSGTAKPTKYHYYPHNQHIYLLPECAIQQVCNAVYVRLNYTQPLCACPSRYRDPCSASLNEDDQHTTKLIGDAKKKAITLAKTCEATTEMRECRSPKDWSLLALQNTRTGKSHYLVICRCPDHFKLEGPMAHDQPTYASVPGIRVFGMMCVKPGYSVRRPSVQPPKRYQLQKPYYLTNSNQYSSIKDNRPNNYLQDSYQSQHQANYQYLNRPESSPIISSHTEFPEPISLNSFGGGIYGRNNEQKGETIAAEEGSEDNSETTSKREKRSTDYLKDDMPEFPWHRLEEFQRSIIWD